MKKIIIPLILCMLAAFAVLLSGCSGGNALEKANKDIEKNDDFHIGAQFDSERDILQINLNSGGDVDLLFETLNKDLEGADVGTIYFRTYYALNDDELAKISQGIGDLSASSIKMLGVAGPIIESKDHSWTKAISKSEGVYIPLLTELYGYKADEMKDVKKVWTGAATLAGIDVCTNVEEIALLPDIELEQETTQDLAGDAADKTDELQPDQQTGQNTDENAEGEAAEESTLFDEGINGVESVTPLRKLEKLERIYILPDEPSYKLGISGAAYIYALSNVAPDVMINKPEEPFSEDNMIKISEVDISILDQNPSLKESILEEFLERESKSCYSKGIKFDKSSKSPAITGKALIYKATPSSDYWAGSRKWFENGVLITGKDLGGKVKTPEASHDYDTFIYVYPVYSRTGVYTSGTKAYSETYMAQVFDLKNKIAYKPRSIDTAAAPQSFQYPAGSPPSKKSGEVSDSTIYNYLKKLGGK